ncbi:hypothetical protein DL768_010522 [Monosporascus sp. mg162]|nr:hypothetical protein DL768_010522 [Monosporascus sp. mg162]
MRPADGTQVDEAARAPLHHCGQDELRQEELMPQVHADVIFERLRSDLSSRYMGANSGTCGVVHKDVHGTMGLDDLLRALPKTNKLNRGGPNTFGTTRDYHNLPHEGLGTWHGWSWRSRPIEMKIMWGAVSDWADDNDKARET